MKVAGMHWQAGGHSSSVHHVADATCLRCSKYPVYALSAEPSIDVSEREMLDDIRRRRLSSTGFIYCEDRNELFYTKLTGDRPAWPGNCNLHDDSWIDMDRYIRRGIFVLYINTKLGFYTDFACFHRVASTSTALLGHRLLTDNGSRWKVCR